MKRARFLFATLNKRASLRVIARFGRILECQPRGFSMPVRLLHLSHGLFILSLMAVADDTKSVINHNPLPDITHEEFVSLLGPLLAPDNYAYGSPGPSPMTSGSGVTGSGTSPAFPPGTPFSQIRTQFSLAPNSPAPFEWLHFEGRSVKTTLSNITGIDGLARDRKWRSHCVFSLDVGRRAKQGVEAVSILLYRYGRAYNPCSLFLMQMLYLSISNTLKPARRNMLPLPVHFFFL
jgi:hypothetical protein